MKRKAKARDHESYWTLSIISLLIPMVGIILGIVYLTRSEMVDRKLGEHLIVMAIVSIIIFSFIWSLQFNVGVV